MYGSSSLRYARFPHDVRVTSSTLPTFTCEDTAIRIRLRGYERLERDSAARGRVILSALAMRHCPPHKFSTTVAEGTSKRVAPLKLA